MKKVSLTVVLLSATILLSGTANSARGIAEGDAWLKWSGDARQLYATCYILAVQHGFQMACKAMAKSRRSGQASSVDAIPGQSCMAKMPRFSKNVEYYAEKITNYYVTYPSDRFAMIHELLDRMADSNDMSVEQIHAELKERLGQR